MKFKILLILIMLFAFFNASEITAKSEESAILYAKYLSNLQYDKLESGFLSVIFIKLIFILESTHKDLCS